MPEQTSILIHRSGAGMVITLNRPEAINSLTLEMVRAIDAALREAAADSACQFVLMRGSGGRGFCAGGDIRDIAEKVRAGRHDESMVFFREEYRLDLAIHRFPKPVIVLADGVCMGGGLGLAAGAAVVVATERTRMAMPETRIGFFPDIGATGWLHAKCPPGYPEYLGLVGHEITGAECLRLGFAGRFMESSRIDALAEALLSIPRESFNSGENHLHVIRRAMDPFSAATVPANPSMDHWVKEYFHGAEDIATVIRSLKSCSHENDLCEEVFHNIGERSPTALALTLRLLQLNRGRPLEEVFRRDLAAAEFIINHHDFYEGVRARLIDRDNSPRWEPADLRDVTIPEGLLE